MKSLLVLTRFIFFFFFLSSCQKESFEIDTMEIGEIKSHLVSLDQAERIAELYSIFGNNMRPSLRMGSGGNLLQRKDVLSTFPIDFEVNNPTFYIINYIQGGFVIVAGDDRVNPILAHSDFGNFPIQEEAYYPGGLVAWMYSTHERFQEVRAGNKERHPAVVNAWEKFYDMRDLIQVRTPLIINLK